MKIKAYQIEESINNSKFCSYLIYGQNKGLIKEKIDHIKNAFKKKKWKDWNYKIKQWWHYKRSWKII